MKVQEEHSERDVRDTEPTHLIVAMSTEAPQTRIHGFHVHHVRAHLSLRLCVVCVKAPMRCAS